MKKKSIWMLLFCYGLYCVFTNLAHPITPTMFIEKNFPAYLYGLAFATMSMALFLASPFWGRLGDYIGHGKIIAVTMPVYGLAQIGFGWAETVSFTLFVRFLAGFFSAGASVCSMAYLVNLTDGYNRGKVMAYYAAITSVASAFGYFIGGVVGNVSIPAVFVLQFLTLLATGILSYFTLGDMRGSNGKFSFGTTVNPFRSFGGLEGQMPAILKTFMAAVLLTSLASTAYDNSFNYYLKDALNLPSSYNGIIKAVIGIVTLTVNFTVNIYIVKKTEARKSIIAVLLLCGISSAAVPFIHGLYPFFIGNIIFFMFNAIYQPIQQDIVTQGTDSRTSGTISGIFNAVRSVGMIAGALFSGLIYTAGNKLPFICTSVLFFMSVAISYINYVQYKNNKVRENING